MTQNSQQSSEENECDGEKFMPKIEIITETSLNENNSQSLTRSKDSVSYLNTASSSTNESAGDALTATQHETSNARHTASTIALCLCTFIQAYLLISVFPYSGYMVIDLIRGTTEETAGPYSGLLASSFMAGRALSAYHWGKVADRYGRKFVLNSSLVLSCLFSVLFGMARTFRGAMIWRFFSGLSNGIVATAKTAVTELARGNDGLEKRAMGLVIGMRGWGFLISPAVGGFLAEPLRQYPDSKVVLKFEPVLSRYPFLLPNLVGAILCILTCIAVSCCIEETLPKERRRSVKFIVMDLCEFAHRKFNALTRHLRSSPHNRFSSGPGRNGESRLLLPSKRDALQASQESAGPPEKIEKGNKGAPLNGLPNGPCKNCDENDTETKTATISSLMRRKNTRRHLLAYWMFSFVVVCVDEAFPLFCISRDGGLALSEASIGKILSGAGLIFACCQYAVYAVIVHRYGLYPSLTIGSLFGVPLVVLIPLSVLLNRGSSTDNELSWAAFIFLTVLMAISKIFSCLFFTSIAIATNKTVSASQRGTMNGLAMVGGSVTKGLGPTFAGLLVAFSFASGIIPPRFGSLLVFTVIGLLGLAVVGELRGLSDEECGRDSETNKVVKASDAT